MSTNNSHYTKHDRRIWEEELESFIPARVYDAHGHLMSWQHMPEGSVVNPSNPEVDMACFHNWSQMIYPGRELNYLLLGMPVAGIDEEAQSKWLVEQIAAKPAVRCNRLVTPRSKLSDLEAAIKENPQMVGFKPYRIFSTTGDIHNCRIHDFLPHEQMELANEHGLIVTMHLSQSDGCADPDNLADLTEYTHKRYPRIRWVLAHCARSFTYYAIRKAVERLRDLPNIWYDLSAVTDLRPHLTLFQNEDHRRLLYGSDGLVATNFHGSYVSLGRAWQALVTDTADIAFPHTHNRPILCIYEELLAIKHAAEIAQLTRTQVEDIFWNNAQRLLNT